MTIEVRTARVAKVTEETLWIPDLLNRGQNTASLLRIDGTFGHDEAPLELRGTPPAVAVVVVGPLAYQNGKVVLSRVPALVTEVDKEGYRWVGNGAPEEVRPEPSEPESKPIKFREWL